MWIGGIQIWLFFGVNEFNSGAGSNLKSAKANLSIGVPALSKLSTGVAKPKLSGGMQNPLVLSERLASSLMNICVPQAIL